MAERELDFMNYLPRAASVDDVFDFIKTLKPSERGELEITDVNNFYIRAGKIAWDVLEGWWTDAGTFDSLQYAGGMVAKTGANKL